jgi:hypothetical protein
MKAPSITIDRKLKTVTLVLSLETARPSKATGKTMLIASTRGLRTSNEQYARRPVLFTANVFFYPANPVDSGEGSEDSTGAGDDSPRVITKKRPRLNRAQKLIKEGKIRRQIPPKP